MAIKKSELYSSLWKSCDELRGGMDASQYKDYVLTLLFVKYVSDKSAGNPNALIEVPEGGSFADMVRLKGDKEIGDKINKIIGRLAEANELRGVIDLADFNDEDKLGKGKEMVDRLTKLVAIFENIDLRANRTEGDDLLGDAYEYLMRHFATESGKSKGQFYTPAEVSRIMAKVLGVGRDTRQDQAVYDPTCGSGSLLLKVHDEAPRGLSIFGQEMDNATWALARMNMILHDAPTAEIWKGNTLSGPHWKEPDGSLKTFDFAVANPPFSQKNWTSGLTPAHDEFSRFELGVPPTKNGDYAFLLHILKSLKSTGKAAVILPHGVLFRGNAEAVIRRNLVRRGLIKGIIGLPPNLFYGTGIPACIIVLDKENAGVRTGIFMMDASRGFMKDGNKNRLRSQDIHKIVDVFTRQESVERYSRMVSFREIQENDYNLNLPRYIDSSEPEDLHDLDAHLSGGIPERDVDALRRYWFVLPGVRDSLFAPGRRADYLDAKLPAHEVKPAILSHPDFTAFAERVRTILAEWKAAHEAALAGLEVGSDAKALIHGISEDLLQRFAAAELVDRYDVYQHLMDYWGEVMQDDVYQIVSDGWLKAARLRLIVEDKENKSKETPDLVVNKKKYKADLIPPALVVARYFAAEQTLIEEMQAR
ncbi:MAG: type I restriction-modification system subunit M, partial [Gemmatimonadota bacterium]|nr:type I restriction-modification system subunit M [Gemmatimonadota bacterium]